MVFARLGRVEVVPLGERRTISDADILQLWEEDGEPKLGACPVDNGHVC